MEFGVAFSSASVRGQSLDMYCTVLLHYGSKARRKLQLLVWKSLRNASDILADFTAGSV